MMTNGPSSGNAGDSQSRYLLSATSTKRVGFSLPFDYLAVLLVGLVTLFLSYSVGFPHLSQPDEIQYAIVGRNIATDHNFMTNVYNPNVIIEQGYPRGEFHVAGYMVIIALSYLLIGQSEYAALLPNQFSYIVGGVLLYVIGKWLFNKQVGWGAAILFFFYPGNFSFASTFMAEPTALLFSVLFLFVWVRTLVSPRWLLAPLMALIIVLGMTQRETNLAFLLPALYALWIWPQSDERGKAVVAFLLVFVFALVFIFFPLNSIRGVQTGAASITPFAEGLNPMRIEYSLLFERFFKNVHSLSEFEGKAEDFGVMWQFFLIAVSVLAFIRGGGRPTQRQIAGYSLVVFALGFSVLSLIHFVANRSGLRILLFAMPPTFLLLSMMISQITHQKLRSAVFVVLVTVSLLVAVRDGAELGMRREEFYLDQDEISNTLVQHLGSFHPQRVIVPGRTYLYAWRAYPVEIYRLGVTDLSYYQALRERVGEKVGEEYPFDAMVVRGEEAADTVNAAIKAGMIKGGYFELDGTADTGFFFFVRGTESSTPG